MHSFTATTHFKSSRSFVSLCVYCMQQYNKFDNFDVTQLVHAYFTVWQTVRLAKQTQRSYFLNEEIN